MSSKGKSYFQGEAVRVGAAGFKNVNELPDTLACYVAALDDIRRHLYAIDEIGRSSSARILRSCSGG